MFIRNSTMEDLPRMMELFADARKYMAENGNPNQWKTTNPPEEKIREDILHGDSFVCVAGKDDRDIFTGGLNPLESEPEVIVGTFFFRVGVDPTYLVIDGEWADNEAPYAVVHRITSDRNTRGVGTFCLSWAFDQHHNVCIDTHEDNKPMQSLLKKLGFRYCGIIKLENGEDRLAFQKI